MSSGTKTLYNREDYQGTAYTPSLRGTEIARISEKTGQVLKKAKS